MREREREKGFILTVDALKRLSCRKQNGQIHAAAAAVLIGRANTHNDVPSADLSTRFVYITIHHLIIMYCNNIIILCSLSEGTAVVLGPISPRVIVGSHRNRLSHLLILLFAFLLSSITIATGLYVYGGEGEGLYVLYNSMVTDAVHTVLQRCATVDSPPP